MESYVVVYNRDIEAFQKRCSFLVNEGYVPSGGIQFKNQEFFQVMWLPDKKVMLSEEPEPEKEVVVKAITKRKGRPPRIPSNAA